MAATGGTSVVGAGGSVTTLDSGSLAVTGTDLAIVAFGVDDNSPARNKSFAWDPTGNNESPTGTIAQLTDNATYGNYVDIDAEYWDDPTAATAVVRMTISGGGSTAAIGVGWFTSAANIPTADFDTNGFTTTGTSSSVTVPNAATGDIILDFIAVGDGAGNTAALTEGADQTEAGEVGSGNYLRAAMSTQAGADGGVMSWSITNAAYGCGHIGVRVQDSGGGGGGPTFNSGLQLLGVGT